MRASVIAENAGVPTVSIVCEGFQRQALATGRGLGLDDLPLAVLRGHVDTQSHDEMIALFCAESSIKRPNKVEEVAAVAVMLASDAARNITGNMFPVDGGTMPY